MVKARRPMRAFFYWLMLTAAASHATSPALTTITDVIYRGDGTPASGTLVLTWPAFTTADNKPVAAGTLSVNVGPSGAIALALAPNAGATPAGTFYRVVLKLNDMHCSIAFTRMTRAVDAEVLSGLPGQAYRTRLTGSLSEGAECRISMEPALHFYGQYVPAPGEKIIVRYRAGGRATSRILDATSVASLQRPGDNGTRGIVRHVKLPAARTSVDCENAVLALLDDSVQPGWAGEYRTWSGFLPGGAQDIFPGDALDVDLPSQGARFVAVVREVEIEVADVFSERSKYRIIFADDAAEPLAVSFDTARTSDPVNTVGGLPPSGYLAEVSSAEFTEATSTTVSIDAGSMPPVGGGFEVRRTDSGWGMANDRNLAGRFATRNFTLPRLSRVQDYYLRQYDLSVPPKYSRNSILLHLDYPL